MPVIAKQIAGILNSDDNNETIHPTHHKMARNVVFRGMDGNYRAQSCVGNRNVDFTLPAYDNQCIGSFYDQLKQRVFFFNYNSYGFHGIYMYDRIADTVSKVLLNFTDSQEDLFDFSLDYPIPSVNILYRTEEDGDLLVWTDRSNRPQCLNIKHALSGQYGAYWKASYLTVAKMMPLIAPVCAYADDNSVSINNLRKKLYQFRYRWVYRNLEKSTWSPWSKLFSPLDPDDIATDIDPQKNNRIDVTIQTGDTDVVAIEIAARQSVSPGFSDPFLVATLNKEQGIYDNQTYVYEFFNDSSYPYIDLAESLLLYDYVPKKANTQELLNGNVIIYGGVTEGYTFNETLSIDLSVGLIDFVSTGSGSVALNKTAEDWRVAATFPNDISYVSQLDFSGTPVAGDVYTISIYDGVTTHNVSYTVLPGNTLADVVAGMSAAIAAANITPTGATSNITATPFTTFFYYVFDGVGYTYTSTTGQSLFLMVEGNSSSNVGSVLITGFEYTYAPSNQSPPDGVSNSIYKHKSRYSLGLVYFDEFGVTNGVITNPSMLFETPEVTTTGDAATQIPKITVSLNHQPPIWAKKFSFVRTSNLSVANLWSTLSAATGKDANYGYLNITNLQNNETEYPVYDFTSGDRVRIIGEYGSSSVISVYDFPVVALVEDPTISGVAKTGYWLKIPYNAVITQFGTINNYLIEIYTPALNTQTDSLVYYEFGETYNVLNPGEANRYHEGRIMDQTAVQPARFEFTRGDFYLKERKIPLNADLTGVDDVFIVDMSVSDLFPSKVVGNGRTFIVDEFAAEKYYPTIVRYSEAYQQNTNINQTNRFYPLNFDEYDRARGDIQRLKVRGTNMRVFQSRGVGVVGVYREMLTNADGSTNLIQNSQIINTINYYSQDYGMGNEFCSLASGSTQDYFTDPVLGYQIRVSGDGMTNLTELYKGQFYISSLLSPYAKTWYREDGSKAKIIGCYDFSEEEFLTVLQAGERSLGEISPYTFTFNEKRNAYSSFFDFSPEWVCSVQDKILSWKNGQLWIHDDGYANFYGAGVDPSITLVFGDPIAVKKNFLAISYQANEAWTSATTGDVITSYINPQTNIQQQSQLKSVDYEDIEGKWCSAFLFDAYSRSSAAVGLVDGDSLTGFWLQIKLTYSSDGEAWLYMPAITYNPNNRNY